MTKLRTLSSAVSELVEPGDALHFSFTHNRSHALAWEVARQFAGTRSLSLLATGLLDYAIVLEACGAVDRASSAFAGMTYPAAGPSPPTRELAARAGSDPDWTNLTATLRLMAGALGVPAIATHALSGTSLGAGPGRATVVSPFDDSELTLLAPLRADVALVHVPVADSDGNAFTQAPDGEGLWGVWGARKVIVSAERVVGPDELRAMGPAPGLPAAIVDAVVEARFGAHPQAQFVWDPRLPVEAYAEDYAFRDALRAAARAPETLGAWIEQWVLGADRERYLEQLGDERLAGLVRLVRAPVPARPEPVDTVSASEAAAVVATRWLNRKLRREALAHRPLFAGIGLSHLVAFAASRVADQDEVPVQLVAEVGMMGFQPPDGDPYLFSATNARTAVTQSDFPHMLAGIGGPLDRGTITVLAAGELDRHGRLNSSRAADGSFLVGSGGANDLAAGVSELLVVVPASPRRLVADLRFVTAAPQHLRAVATDLGVMEPGEDGELELVAVVAADDARLPEAVQRAQASCGWPLRVASSVTRLPLPTSGEVDALRRLDPQRRLLR